MTTFKALTGDPVTAVERLSQRFADVFGNPDSAEDVFSADVFLDLNMPVWRFQLRGAAAFAAQLEARIRASPQLWYQFYPYWRSIDAAPHT